MCIFYSDILVYSPKLAGPGNFCNQIYIKKLASNMWGNYWAERAKLLFVYSIVSLWLYSSWTTRPTTMKLNTEADSVDDDVAVK